MPQGIFRLKKWTSFIANYYGLVLRVLICWSIGLLALQFDENDSYDLRFLARGSRPVSKDVVIINTKKNELATRSSWKQTLTELLKHEPKAIGITLFTRPAIEDERVFWAAEVGEEGQIKNSLQNFLPNIGAGQVEVDPDRVVRRFHQRSLQIPNLAQRLAQKEAPQGAPSHLINFHGPAETFPSFSLEEILNNPQHLEELRGRIILIGTKEIPGHILLTPLGPMSRAEVLANTVETLLYDKWIKKFDINIYRLILLFLLLASVWILFRYPQTVSLSFYLWMATASIATSVWVFDTFYYWLPTFSVCLQLFVTFITFVSFQLAMKEKQHWRFTQEARSFQELEQLKNNFISLFSHDLKTPIARMQAVIDRLLSENQSEVLKADLQTLRSSSDELHHYIKKILHVTKVEAKKIKLKKEITDINLAVEDVVRKMSPLAQSKKLNIELSLEPMFSIEADTTLITEVILNFVDNAIKFTPEGGKIKVSTHEVSEGVEVSVEDSGDGISEDEQKVIWNKFTRGKKHETETKGSGLGLYLSKFFIELHGGEVQLVSQAGQGTKISFVLPFESPEQEMPGDFNLSSKSTEDSMVHMGLS